jgi:hypothetical protein
MPPTFHFAMPRRPFFPCSRSLCHRPCASAAQAGHVVDHALLQVELTAPMTIRPCSSSSDDTPLQLELTASCYVEISNKPVTEFKCMVLRDERRKLIQSKSLGTKELDLILFLISVRTDKFLLSINGNQ